jgi:hypothetical protein
MDKEESARRDRVRIKLFSSMLATYGYALLAGAAWEPLTKGEAFTAPKLGLTLVAVALHALALYIAPNGEAK